MAKKKKQLPAKGGSKSNRYDRIVAIGIIVALAAIGLTLWGPLKKFQYKGEKVAQQQTQKKQTPAPERPERKAEKVDKKTEKKTEKTAEKTEKKEKKEHAERREIKEQKKREEIVSPVPERKAIVAIVIDDLGQDLKPAREIAALPASITFAVMPGLPQSRKVAELAKKGNREILLHLPMEYREETENRRPGCFAPI